MTFEETLAEWIPSQRWFAGKGARILDVAIVADTELASGDPGLRHLIVAVSQGGRRVDTYQLFLGLRAELPDELRHVLIGRAQDGRLAYDALHDPELTRWLLHAIADDAEAGPLRFRREPGVDLDTGAGQPGADRRAEQHQPDLRRGEHPQGVPPAVPGINPDLEVNRALAQPRLHAHRPAAGLGREHAGRRPGRARHPVQLPARRHRRLVTGGDQRP